VAPKNFYQVLTICAEINGFIASVFTVLMTGKDVLLYKKVFQKIKEDFPNVVEPKMVLADFEMAIAIALKAVFPGAKQTGCTFHYTQAITRKWRSPGLCIIF